MRFICMSNRSGSSWLCAMLRRLKLGYDAGEWFNPARKYPFDDQDVDAISKQWRLLCEMEDAADQRMVVKCSIPQMERFALTIDRKQDIPHVFLKRGDVIRQAISTHLMQLRQANAEIGVHSLDPVKVRQLAENFKSQNERWAVYFQEQEIEPLRIDYESMSAAPESTLQQVVNSFDAELKDIPERIRRLDCCGVRRKNSVPFEQIWLDAMSAFETDDDWQSILQRPVPDGELFLG